MKHPQLIQDDRARLPHVFITPGGMDVKEHAIQPTPKSLIIQKEKVDATQAKVVELNLKYKK